MRCDDFRPVNCLSVQSYRRRVLTISSPDVGCELLGGEIADRAVGQFELARLRFLDGSAWVSLNLIFKLTQKLRATQILGPGSLTKSKSWIRPSFLDLRHKRGANEACAARAAVAWD